MPTGTGTWVRTDVIKKGTRDDDDYDTDNDGDGGGDGDDTP